MEHPSGQCTVYKKVLLLNIWDTCNQKPDFSQMLGTRVIKQELNHQLIKPCKRNNFKINLISWGLKVEKQNKLNRILEIQFVIMAIDL